jgi:hypothetical protein
MSLSIISVRGNRRFLHHSYSDDGAMLTFKGERNAVVEVMKAANLELAKM